MNMYNVIMPNTIGFLNDQERDYLISRPSLPFDDIFMGYEESPKYTFKKFAYGIPEIVEVKQKNNATVIRWADGTKTTVLCGDGETYDAYTGFMAAVVKKMFGSTGTAKRIRDKKNLDEQAAKAKAAADKKAAVEAARKAEEDARKAAKFEKNKAKAERRKVERLAEKMRIEMLAKKLAKEMIEAEKMNDAN